MNMNLTNNMNNGRTVERNENITIEEQEKQNALNFTCKKNEIFNYWVNENPAVNQQNNFSQTTANKTNGNNKHEEMNMLKTLWNRENKNNAEDNSNNSQLDTLLKSQYIENYLSSVFDTKQPENELPIYTEEQIKANNKALNKNGLDGNAPNVNDSSFFNYKSTYSNYLNEKGNITNTNDIEFEDKNYINNLIRNSTRTEDDDFFSFKSNKFSSLTNDQNLNLKKAFTQHQGNAYTNFSNDNNVLKNFISLDINNVYRNKPQTFLGNFGNEDISSFLINNKEFIDKEFIDKEFIDKEFIDKEYNDLNKKEIKFQNALNFENTENSRKENLDYIDTNMINMLVSTYDNEITDDNEQFKLLEKNSNYHQNNNNNNNFINTDANVIEKCLSLPLVMKRNTNNSENVNFQNVLSEWSTDYLNNTKNDETNNYADSILQYMNQGRSLNISENRDGNINNNNSINRRNTTYSNTNMNKRENFSFIPDFSPMNNSLISSLNNKNSYFTSDLSGQNNCAMKNETEDTDAANALENVYVKYTESIRNVQNKGQEESFIQQLKSTGKNVNEENKEMFNDSIYNNKNNNGNNNNNNNTKNENFAHFYKKMLINIIETGENDIELFERVVNTIFEYHKYKNSKKNVQHNNQTFYRNDNNNVNKTNKVITDAFVKEAFMNNFAKDQEGNSINSKIYSFFNENNEEIKDAQNQTQTQTQTQTQAQTQGQSQSQSQNQNQNQGRQGQGQGQVKNFNQTNPPIKYASTHARFTADYSDSSNKSAMEDMDMYNDATESTLETGRQMNDSTFGNSYFSCLQNQLSANAKLEKEQMSILQLKREKENKIEENRRMLEENVDNKQKRSVNKNISDFKFDFEKNVVESSKRFREETRAEKLLETMKCVKYENQKNMTTGQTTTGITHNNTYSTNIFGNTNNAEEKRKLDFNKTFGGETTPIKNLKSFFSSVTKNTLNMQDDSLNKSKGNTFVNSYMNNKGTNKFSKGNKIDDFSWDRKSSLKNSKFSQNGIFKKGNTPSTINNNNGYNNFNSCENDIKNTYKSDNMKSNFKLKNNIETKKLTPTELKTHITKGDEICLRKIIESLYEDRIFPLVINLNGRADELKCKEIVKNNLLTAYGLYPGEYIIKKTVAGDEDIVLFTKNMVSDNYFVCLNNAEDTYSEVMWTQFADYLEEIAEKNDSDTYQFSGGRYGMAKELRSRNLSFFKEFCLGELCHIVHLSTTKKLIAYEQNLLKPISQCQKYKNAQLGRLNTEEKIMGNYITSMEELKYYIKALLKYYKNGFNISTLKKKLKTRFNKQISEIVFHCIKLIDVLQLDELKDICVIDKDLKYIQSV